MSANMNKIPVILDTDIGGDIDDTWALSMLLKCPELDPKLVVSDSGDTHYRSRLAAKLLEVAGGTDVPVGTGIRQTEFEDGGLQGAWVGDCELADYPGTDDAMTVEDAAARPVNVAMDWKDLGAFEDLLVERLTANIR